MCSRFGVKPLPAEAGQKVGIAANVGSGLQPINGLRRHPEGDTTGWYIWAGEELSDDPDFFEPVHLEHLVSRCPEVLPYLLLPVGYRFLVAPGHEDVWWDDSFRYEALQPHSEITKSDDRSVPDPISPARNCGNHDWYEVTPGAWRCNNCMDGVKYDYGDHLPELVIFEDAADFLGISLSALKRLAYTDVLDRKSVGPREFLITRPSLYKEREWQGTHGRARKILRTILRGATS